GCRSTAPGANRSGTHSHPRRVLLRYGVVAGVFVGAPPRCEPGKHTFAPEAGAPTIRGGGRLVVGAPPRCEPSRHTFAPGAGAPTSEGGTRAADLNSTHYPISCKSHRWRRPPAPGRGLRCATHSRGSAAGGVHDQAGPCGSSHGARGGPLPDAHAAAAAVPAAGSGCDGGSPGAAGHGAADGGDAGCTAA